MRTIALGDTGIYSSVLGFGCSGLLGRSGRRESLRALGAAYEAGITFYDTARSYGYGESEALLGEFFKGRRDKIIIATKFGVLPSPQRLWKRAAKPVARTMMSLIPATRSFLRHQAAAQLAPRLFTISVLQQSIDQSLGKLRSDYVDLLFMHSPCAAALEDEPLLLAMEKLVQSGKVRVAGISAEPEVAAIAYQDAPRPLRALQFPCNLFDFSTFENLRPARDFALLANNPFGGVERVHQTRTMLRDIAEAETTPVLLRDKLTPPRDEMLADAVLNLVLHRSGIHVVIPAMMQLQHLKTNVAALEASRFSAEELDWLRNSLVSRHAGRASA